MKETRNVPFFKPSIGVEEEQAVLEVLRSGWLTTGPKVVEFERAFAEYCGAKHAVALSSCTAALHLALESLGLSAKDEVITTPFTFSATASEIIHSGAKIKFVDVKESDGNIDENLISQAISENTKALIPVHFAGSPCGMESIMSISREYGIKVIEDAAHALESKYKGAKIGSIGDFTCFSFYATKNITTAEGGMLTCDNDEDAENIRVLSLHGMSKDAWRRYLPGKASEGGSDYYHVARRGFKYNMSDIQAALGIAQLKKVDLMWQRRDKLVKLYREKLSCVSEIGLFTENSGMLNGRHLMIIKLNLDHISINRNQFVRKLKERGVGCSIHFVSLHLHPYYKQSFGFEDSDFPVAFDLSNRVLTLPLYPDMSEDDLNYVVNCVKDIIFSHKISRLVSVR